MPAGQARHRPRATTAAQQVAGRRRRHPDLRQLGRLALASPTTATTPSTPPSAWSARVQAIGVPVIYFGVETAGLLPAMAANRRRRHRPRLAQPLDEGWRAVGHSHAVQGNLDPITLFAPLEVLEAARQGDSRAPPPAAPATSSTSATASSPTPRSKTCRPWCAWFASSALEEAANG